MHILLIRKRNFLHVLFFTLLVHIWVPKDIHAIRDAPEPDPVRFALANLLSFSHHTILPSPNVKSWRTATGGARLFGLSEVQPFFFNFTGPALKGRFRIVGNGLKVGAYSESSLGLGYDRSMYENVQVEFDIEVHQIAIKDYGSATCFQLNGQAIWQIQPTFALALKGINLNAAHIGKGHYPLPRRFALGGSIKPTHRTNLFMELEKDTRYPLQTRLGATVKIYGPLIILIGFQTEPGIISSGMSCQIGAVQTCLAYQYHPDLGYSQCYGLAVSF